MMNFEISDYGGGQQIREILVRCVSKRLMSSIAAY
jgi:hypothetical protein